MSLQFPKLSAEFYLATLTVEAYLQLYVRWESC
jgi:hypothetical protein